MSDRAVRRRDADLDCVESLRSRQAYDRMLRELFADVPAGCPLPVEVDAALARLKARIDAEPDDVPDVVLPFRVSTPAVGQVARWTAARALWRAGAALLELGVRLDPAVEAGQ